MEEQVYESRGATSWETKMYSTSPIRLNHYKTYKPYPVNIDGIEDRGMTGWEVLMMQKSSVLPTGRRVGTNRSLHTVYSSRIKGVVKKPSLK